jgi:hypothetical protein
MTFQEAIAKKQTINSPYTKIGVEYKVFVTPNNEHDNARYMDAIRFVFSFLTDERAVQFSSNGQFRLQGLAMFEGLPLWDDLN